MNLLPLVLALLISMTLTSALACDCEFPDDHDALIESSFNFYQDIFTGTIVKRDNELWIEVQEVFKGDLETGQLLKTGHEEHSCSYYFLLEGLGLFYGQTRDNEFFADLCSPTRRFERPFLYPAPPPPQKGRDANSEVELQKMEVYFKNEKARLEYEIEELRKYKSKVNPE